MPENDSRNSVPQNRAERATIQGDDGKQMALGIAVLLRAEGGTFWLDASQKEIRGDAAFIQIGDSAPRQLMSFMIAGADWIFTV